MTNKEALEIMKTYNTWRRGAEIDMPNVYLLGIAIDLAIEALAKQVSKEDKTNTKTKWK